MNTIKTWAVDAVVFLAAVASTVGFQYWIDTRPGDSWLLKGFSSIFVFYSAIQIVVSLLMRQPIRAVLFDRHSTALGPFIGERLFMLGFFLLGGIGSALISCCVRLPWNI